MKKILTAVIGLLIVFSAANAAAQTKKTVPAYKLTAMKITPYDGMTGKFEEEIKMLGDERSFFNDLDTSLIIEIEVSGITDSENYPARQLEVTVTEGKKVKSKTTGMIGILNENGKYYAPVFLARPMCDEIKITARIIGQKTPATITRKISFQCGE